MPNIPHQPITAAEAADLLSADVRTVHRLIQRGDLEGVKAHGGLRAPYLIAREAVEALAASRKERVVGYAGTEAKRDELAEPAA